MSEKQHHHHQQHMDEASKFKRQSLMALERRKKISKWLWRILVAIAVIMFISVVVSYVSD